VVASEWMQETEKSGEWFHWSVSGNTSGQRKRLHPGPDLRAFRTGPPQIYGLDILISNFVIVLFIFPALPCIAAPTDGQQQVQEK